MREILFRGKNAVGEWAYGYYRKGILDGNPISLIIAGGDIINTTMSAIQVCDTETVGQYTGLTDKNGEKIFEGDIVKYNNRLHKVVYENRNGCAYFGIVISELDTWGFTYSVPCKKMEVVGNIYDNPELLGDD